MMNPVLCCLERTVEKYPDKVAIADQEKEYTFRDMQVLAQRMGTVVREKENGGHAVGVFVERNAETAVLFLGVVYSGNYYVPLDPELPDAKLKAIFADASLYTILGGEDHQQLLDRIGFHGNFLTLEDISDIPAEMPEAGVDTPLYMVYTSGSTGKPKGVLKSHGAMESYLHAYLTAFDFSENDVIGNQTPFFFDASAKDFYLMLWTGARLEIIPSECFSFPVRLIQYLNAKKVTFISWVPSALCIVTQLNTFLEVLPTTLRCVFFVGEVFPRKQLDKWRKALPDIDYVNLYGSSELAGICCYYRVQDDLPEGAPLPLGKPLQNCKIYLMDDGKCITQPGHVGEIYVASPALALCYYHDPEKTANSFFTMTLPDGTVQRVFKTGDMASYDANGNLVFAARKDYQIKHMGRRIELGEIEAVADELAEIRRCCCLYHTERKRITMFCELSPECNWNGRQVRSALKGHLTDYMLPAKVIVMDVLPVNANGKIDRQALQLKL